MHDGGVVRDGEGGGHQHVHDHHDLPRGGGLSDNDAASGGRHPARHYPHLPPPRDSHP